ncbi:MULTISPECIES: TRAP transporter substrate-binding protein [Sulfitobacter]|jgi:TRAP-type C4-dicarboxylate transport system substrate-binding protein|uniref:TRAP transporter substrate-binding protein n=1 Tax=Sulfitobacter profundi TaxID=2679961 RepID=A0ABW1Z2M3_9RHOB|nr:MULTISPECIES: TRAP transporter substrate-binding protein [Sulfitobacter]HIF77166.1 TRAP transporter substrate-binding protein [Sulfitobacter sp.]AYE87841.1 C4-dicarboxylate ABC transporter substrate-binding protein [Sulfitobacter sp. D7]KZX93075.1 C4-dicarboxylate ABC transporter substrate-binding protein [Sulfitobacter sp. HI0021]KZX96777.1 C4-dicarboxylate ABC transporter substrate-binding protein [Sulfitobacter sp. HI0027]KZZ03676.1 C4-dicarboxylate ABC transporter substrate-binding prot
MTKFTKFLTTSALALCTATGAFAAETLTISTWLPPSHPVNTGMFTQLTDMMSEASDGLIETELKNGLAPPPAQMDLLLDGAADIAILFHGYTPGRFVGTKLVEIPGYEGNAEAASVAHWRVHEAMLAELDEHRGVKVIALTTHGPGQIHSNKEVASLEDLQGLKTRLGGGVSADVGAELGLVGIQVPAPKVYETLDSGAADAVAMNMGERISFKLNEVAKNVYEMPGGFYRGSFSVIMSQETFDSLPEDVQQKLDSEVFGETASRMMGAVWDQSDVDAREATEAAGDNKIVTASEEDQARFAEMAAKVRDKVIAELDEAGVDGQAAYEMMREEMANASQ